MNQKTENIAVVKQLKQHLTNKLGNNIQDVILFGSRANGTATEDSDYDVLIVLKNDYDWRYKRNLIFTATDISIEKEVMFDIKVLSNTEIEHSFKAKHPMFTNTLKEGIYV